MEPQAGTDRFIAEIPTLGLVGMFEGQLHNAAGSARTSSRTHSVFREEELPHRDEFSEEVPQIIAILHGFGRFWLVAN